MLAIGAFPMRVAGPSQVSLAIMTAMHDHLTSVTIHLWRQDSMTKLGWMKFIEQSSHYSTKAEAIPPANIAATLIKLDIDNIDIPLIP